MQSTRPAMNDRAFLSVFTPSRTSPEDLEAITVQRQALITDAVERVRESATTGNKHHLLFVGPRGTGKTHLVTLLVYRLGQDRALDDRLRVAWLNEDETSTSLLELLRRIYDALAKRYPNEFTAAALDPLFDLTPDAAEGALAQLLLETLQYRTLLVLVENLDALLAGLGQAGQQKLRAFIQEHPVLALVATAQRLVDDIAKRQSAFFGFFQTEHLKTLSVEQARELLQNIARLNNQSDVVAFLDSATGRSRIRALHHLSGGNHRIYIVLSQFITRDSIQSLVDPFAKMVDEMTPYYRELIRWLPAQQRKIVQLLCTQDRPTAVKQIARRLFASQQTVSSQLKDLRDKGYVQAAQRGRESLYEIAEPMMRICVEVKENQKHGPLRVLVDFLRVWYDGRELNARLSDGKTDGIARTYLASAIEANQAKGNLRARLLADGFKMELDDAGRAEWGPRIETYAEQSEELALACGHWAKGEDTEALRILDEIAGEGSTQSVGLKASALNLAAEIHYKKGEWVLAIGQLDAALAMPRAPAQQVAMALVFRGLTYGQIREPEKEIADYSKAIDLPQAPTKEVARALINRGIAYGQLGNIEKEIADYSAAIDLPQAPAEQVAWALIDRGVACGQRGDMDKEIADYSAAINLPQAPVEPIARALINRGLTYWQSGEADQSERDLDAALRLEGAPTEIRFDSQIALAEIRIATGRWYDAITALGNGLREGMSASPPYQGDSTDIIGAFFDSSLQPAIRAERTRNLLQVYRDLEAITQLGEALMQHLGRLHTDPASLPSPDNLETWAAAWEAAGQGIDAFRLPLRLFRTGVDFLKAGGTDRGILLDLNQEERTLLGQVFNPETES
ncbi:ArsR family transcriptional regulator [uncultured Thiodictyon sp.]|uniref:ArsR family transcriptional regulator n=1 Tax=uncultured Thiodictyon sp. TaxID=1846217 RepID=UPI0025FCC592|nr:ArsR family transcriptional regulator [uncultured Thiodictyon sp.]